MNMSFVFYLVLSITYVTSGNGKETLIRTDTAPRFESLQMIIDDPATLDIMCPEGQSETFETCPMWNHYGQLIFQFGLPLDGEWLPPLADPFQLEYYSCTDAASSYIYPHEYPGCGIVYDTAHFILLWDPCGWELDAICYTDDSIFFTIPEFADGQDPFSYTITIPAWEPGWPFTYTHPDTLSSETSYSFGYPLPSNWNEDEPAFLIEIWLIEAGCWWLFGEAVAFDFYYILDIPECENEAVCPDGQSSTFETCPSWNHYNNLVQQFGLPLDGIWQPPLADPNQLEYYSCADAASVYIYPHVYPGCDVVYDTAHFELLWNPCNWELASICYTEDSILFTIPPFPGSAPSSTFTIAFSGEFEWEYLGPFDIDSSNTISVPTPSWFPGGCFNISAIVDGCVWSFGTLVLWDIWCVNIGPCIPCSDPPNAGEDVSITMCEDAVPFDLTSALGGNSDPGGTWSPPLASGGNIFDPVLDGSGTFTYTVSAAGCLDDIASVIVTVTPPCNSNCPEGQSMTYTICPYWSGNYGIHHVNDMLSEQGLPAGGLWSPPLECEEFLFYSSCTDSASVYIYPHEYPGCDVVYDTAHFESLWNPCDWEVQEACFNENEGTLYFTIPAHPGNSGTSTYTIWVEIGAWFYFFENLSLDSSYDLTINNLIDPACFIVSAFLNDSPGCWWDLTFNACDYRECFGSCDCVNPPYAGEDSAINICTDAAPFDLAGALGGNPDPGGSWIPSLNSGGNVFDPATDGSGTYSYVIDGSGCPDDTASIIVAVQPLSPITITGIPAVMCESNPSVILPVPQDGINGEWSGPGVVNNMFSPSGVTGDVMLTFTPDAGLCALVATHTVMVEVAVPPEITGVPSALCVTDEVIELPVVQNAINGNWNGPGVSNNVFDPVGLSGEVLLSFTPDSGQCASVAEVSIVIAQLVIPQITGIPEVLCQSSAQILLPSLQDGVNGEWSGLGVANNMFSPTGLMDVLTLTFNPVEGSCAQVVFAEINVILTTVITITDVPNALCGSSALILPTMQSGFSGNWSGPGVINNTFDPSGLNGNVTLTFTPDNADCAEPAMAEIMIEAASLPDLTDVPERMCQLDAPLPLPLIPGGISGAWSGLGISGNAFDPTGLTDSVLITFIPDTDQCATQAGVYIIIDTAITPMISGIPPAVCQNGGVISLVTVHDGTSGTWSGPGISQNSFSSEGLSGTVQISFTPDPGRCALTTSAQIEITEPPAFVNLTATCDPSAQFYTISFTITGGDSASYVVNGISVTGAHFVSAPLDADSLNYTFLLDDGVGCGPIVISGSVNCACATHAGTMDFSISPVEVCEGEEFVAIHHQDEVLDPDDVLVFVLHDQAGTEPGTIYGMQESPVWTIPPGIEFGKIYYLSAVAGNSNGTGGVDPGDLCLSVSQGVPIIFYQNSVVDLTMKLCNGEGIVVNGVMYDDTHASGTEVIQGGSAHGCDSIINVNLTFTGPLMISINDTLCDGESVTINGTIYDQSNPNDTLMFVSGNCDSTVLISLSFYPAAVSSVQQTLCNGSRLIIGGTVFDETHPEGTVTLLNASKHGCDSVINVSLTFDSVIVEDLKMTLCPDESLILNGTIYDALNPAGTETLQSSEGCDSVIHVSLSFHAESVGFYYTDTLKVGDSIVINNTVYDVSHLIGTEILENASSHGCDSTVHITLYFPSISFTAPECYGASNGTVTILEFSFGLPPYSLQIDNEPPIEIPSFPFTWEGLDAGPHIIKVLDATGLVAIRDIFISVPVLVADAGVDQTIKYGDDAMLKADAQFDAFTWLWTPDDFLSCVDCPDPNVLKPDRSITYTILVSDSSGCTATDEVAISVLFDIKIFVPSAFSPNGDGHNDLHSLYASSGVSRVKSMRYFTRWGELIVEMTNFAPNDPGYVWDGSFKGEQLNPGVYGWIAELELTDGRVKIFSGDVTLVR